MKISELIKRLERKKEKYGNIRVVFYDEGWLCEIDEVKINDSAFGRCVEVEGEALG